MLQRIMNLRFALATAMLISVGTVALSSCSGEGKDDENASIVNIEKGVAPPLAAPQRAESAGENMEVPVGIIGGEEVSVQPVNEEAAEEESSTPVPEKKKKSTETEKKTDAE